MMAMQTGSMATRICVEKPTGTRNAAGEVVDTWATHCHCWAAIKSISGREAFYMAQTHPSVTHRMTTRYQEGVTSTITPKMRVRIGSRTMGIESAINVDERNEEMELLCVEGVADG